MMNADDRDQIAETLALLSYLTDEDRLDRLHELFVPDAVYDMSGSGMGVFKGIDAIRTGAQRLNASGHAPIAHLVVNVVVEERDQETAGVRSRGLMITPDGQLVAVNYNDTFRRLDGRWRISHRVITPLYPASGE